MVLCFMQVSTVMLLLGSCRLRSAYTVEAPLRRYCQAVLLPRRLAPDMFTLTPPNYRDAIDKGYSPPVHMAPQS
jgi:hypothetical protein